MEDYQKIKNIIEALLIVSEGGLTRSDIQNAVGSDVSAGDVNKGIELLKDEYSGDTRAFNISEIAGKCRIITKPEYMPWISNLYETAPERLSGPSLETLAIVAYKQPATRVEIEGVRGVNVGGVLKTLLDKELVKIRGRKDVAGKPLLYGTTEKFLEIFGLNSLDDLPVLKDFKEEDLEFGKTKEDKEVNYAEEETQ